MPDAPSTSSNRRATASLDARSIRRTASVSLGASWASRASPSSSASTARIRSPPARKRATTLCPRAPAAPVIRTLGMTGTSTREAGVQPPETTTAPRGDRVRPILCFRARGQAVPAHVTLPRPRRAEICRPGTITDRERPKTRTRRAPPPDADDPAPAPDPSAGPGRGARPVHLLHPVRPGREAGARDPDPVLADLVGGPARQAPPARPRRARQPRVPGDLPPQPEVQRGQR